MATKDEIEIEFEKWYFSTVTSQISPEFALAAFLAGRKSMEKEIDKENIVPYFGWCDVEGCENEGCGGGVHWRETGYWTICSEHANQHRQGIKQPKMKGKSIEREKSRLPNGYLPTRENK